VTRRARILRVLRDAETNRMVEEINRIRAEREELARKARDRSRKAVAS